LRFGIAGMTSASISAGEKEHGALPIQAARLWETAVLAGLNRTNRLHRAHKASTLMMPVSS